MSYTVNKSNGEYFVISDGTIDTSSTSLVLIGKNYAGYGEFLNENFVRILENFANTTGPANPLKGQLWWDTNNNILKVYSGTSWKISTGATASPFSSPPGDLSSLGGDLWYDTTNSQLKVYSGSNWITVGPQTLVGVADTGSFPATMTDTSSGTHVVVQFKINGVIYAILAYETFTTSVTGFTTIKPGLNFKSDAPSAMVLSIQDTNPTNNTVVQRNAFGGIEATGVTATTVTAGTVTASSLIGAHSGNLVGNVTATTITTTNLSSGAVSASSGYTGTLLTANQPNITTLGNLSALNVAGNVNIYGTAMYKGAEIATVGGSSSFTSLDNTPIGATTPNTGRFTTITATTAILPASNLVIDIGSPTLWFNNIYGRAMQAKYADLAERFHADAEYAPGTVVELGGTAEVTKVVEELSDKVFGVISTNAAYLMNSAAGSDKTHPPIAMSGRVPVRVIGMINKGDRLVSAGNGLARAGTKSELTPWNVIGRSLVTKTDSSEGLIEAIVKINS